MPRGRRIFLACYAASGMAALVYQVAWTRLFSLVLGHTTAASSTVLAAFMGGMAAGAWIGGRVRADPGPRLLQLYAALELVIGAIAVILPTALGAFTPVLAWAYEEGGAPTSLAIWRIGVSLLILGVPAAAMGATFPIAVAWLATAERTGGASPRAPAATVGALYATNTIGAASGAISAGFWLIPAFGLRATTWIGIALNIVAAGGALWLAHRSHIRATSDKKAKPVRATRQVSSVPRPGLASAAAALSGFLALVYEVAWTRLLALVLGPTTYAFAIMAASFIIGIAAGSVVGTRLVRRGTNPAAWLGGTLILTAVSAPTAAWYAASQLPMLVALRVNAGAPLESIILQQVLAAAGLLLPTSVALGASFVVAVAAATGGTDTIGRDTARVYAANTVGAVMGSLAAGFLLIPHLGLQPTFVNIGMFGALGGTLVVISAIFPGNRRRALAGAGALIAAEVAVFAVLPAWDRQLLSSGAYKYSRDVDPDVLEAMLRAGELEYYKEGAAGTVSVRRLAGSRALAIDGKVDASNGGDMLTQRLLGLLPVLLHPGPRDALVIGLGSGVTADAVLASGEVQQVDIVELSPEVVGASEFFKRENNDVLTNPRARLLIADGRSHLQLSARLYDVIVSEPSNPWMAGVAALFTREFFEAARSRLRSGGVFCQWAHTYEISEADLRSIARTFGSVFPGGTMWLVGEGDLLLIATPSGPIESRLTAIANRAQKGSVPEMLAAVGVPPAPSAFVLLSLLTGGASELAAFGADAALQTDDRMSLEFTAARAMYSPPAGAAASLSALGERAAFPAIVTQSVRGATAADWTARGGAVLQAKAFGTAYESFRQALSLDGRSAAALRGSTDAAAGARRLIEHASFLEGVAAAEPVNVEVRLELSHVLAMLGRTDEAIAAATDAARVGPSRAEPLEQLASILADSGDPVRLAQVANELVARFPARVEGRYYQAAALFLAGRAGEAQRVVTGVLGVNPQHAKAQNLLGAVCAALENHECASTAFAAALALDPRDSSVYVNLGYLRLARGDRAAAAGFFGEALTVDATSEAARKGLAEARAGKGVRGKDEG